jgi:DNA-binding response OmpR family regulator
MLGMALRDRSYEKAATLVFDPVAANRTATRASLHTLGFRGVELAPAIEVFENRLSRAPFDLVLAEANGAEADICRLIQALRLGQIGPNPFTVVILTTWRREAAIVGQVVNSGADDLIARPFSTTLLGERIRVQVERRKAFVVTSNYIGPDRRCDPARTGTGQLMEVPNTLKLRMQDLGYEEIEGRIENQIARARAMLNAEKMKCDAVQLVVQRHVLESCNPRASEFAATLRRIQAVAIEIARCAGGTPKAEAVELCEATVCAAETMALQLDAGCKGADEQLDLTALMRALGRTIARLGSMLAPGESSAGRSANEERPRIAAASAV